MPLLYVRHTIRLKIAVSVTAGRIASWPHAVEQTVAGHVENLAEVFKLFFTVVTYLILKALEENILIVYFEVLVCTV